LGIPGATIAQVGASLEPVKLRIELTPFATVRGQVLDPEGKPAAGAVVELDGKMEAADANGNFVFAGLAPGIRIVLATPGDGTAEAGMAVVPTWFPFGDRNRIRRKRFPCERGPIFRAMRFG
jgi:hypothetical protein